MIIDTSLDLLWWLLLCLSRFFSLFVHRWRRTESDSSGVACMFVLFCVVRIILNIEPTCCHMDIYIKYIYRCEEPHRTHIHPISSPNIMYIYWIHANKATDSMEFWSARNSKMNNFCKCQLYILYIYNISILVLSLVPLHCISIYIFIY